MARTNERSHRVTERAAPTEGSAEEPLISVVMNGFNSARYLAQAVDTVRAQSYRRWEIVFWDNQSEDDSEAIMRSYRDPRIRFYRSPRRMPLAEGRNRAMTEARGDWFAFLDCDDIWLPNKLERQLARVAADASRGVGLVYGRTLSFSSKGDEGETVYRYQGRPLPEGQILRQLLLEGNLVPIVSAMISKRAYRTVGGIPNHFTFAEDYWLFVAIAASFQTLCVQDVVCKYRVHDGSATFRNKLASHVESLEVLRHWGAALDPSELRRREAVYHTLIGIEKIRAGAGITSNVIDICTRGSLLFLLRGAVSSGMRTIVQRRRPYA